MLKISQTVLTILLSTLVFYACNNQTGEVEPITSTTQTSGGTAESDVFVMETALASNVHFVNIQQAFDNINQQVMSTISAMNETELQTFISDMEDLQTQGGTTNEYLHQLGLDSTSFYTTMQYVDAEVDALVLDFPSLVDMGDEDLMSLLKRVNTPSSSAGEPDRCDLQYTACVLIAENKASFSSIQGEESIWERIGNLGKALGQCALEFANCKFVLQHT